MTEVLLHIGMDKTGSSSIQHSFAGYDDGSLAYAQLATANHSMPLQMLFRDPDAPARAIRAQGYDRDQILAEREQHRADLVAALDQGRDRVLISAEGVLGLKPDQLEELRDLLAQHCDRIRLLAYVREPMGYASSAFQQGLKAGVETFQVPMPRYVGRLAAMDQVFGRENVTYLRFDPRSFPGQSVVRDFAGHVGADITRLDERRSNESLTLDAAAALFLYNRERGARTGSRELFRARLLLIRLLMREEDRRMERVAKRVKRRLGLKLGRTPKPEDTAADKAPKFRFAQSLVRARLPEDDVAWMERRSGFDLMPGALPAGTGDETGVQSEDHLLEIAAGAKDYLAPMVQRLRLKPAGTGTLELMDALFDHAVAKSG